MRDLHGKIDEFHEVPVIREACAFIGRRLPTQYQNL